MQAVMENPGMSREEIKMATGKIPGLFVKFALPGICGILFVSLQMLVDGLLLGRFVGASAMASVNITLPIFTIFWAISVAVSVGNEFQVSYALGRQKRKDAANAFSTAVLMLLALSLLWSTACFFFGAQAVRLAGASPALFDNSLVYLRTLAWFMPFAGLMLLADYTLKSLGHPLRAVMIMASMVLINLGLDLLFIIGFGWGVKGAALATGISYVAGFMFNFTPFMCGRQELSVWRGRLKPRVALQMLYNGSSEGLGETIGASTALLFNLTMIRYAGESGVAALTAVSYLTYIATTVFLGTSDGIRPVVSFNYGRRQIPRMVSLLKLAAITLAGLGAVLFCALFFQGDLLAGIFFKAEDAAVAAFATGGARIFAFAFLFSGLNILVSGYFTSIGNAKVSAIIAVLNGFVFVALGLLIYPKIWGVNGIWLVVPLSQALTLCLSLPLMLRSLRGLNKQF